MEEGLEVVIEKETGYGWGAGTDYKTEIDDPNFLIK